MSPLENLPVTFDWLQRKQFCLHKSVLSNNLVYTLSNR